MKSRVRSSDGTRRRVGLYIPQTLLRHHGISSRAEATLGAWRSHGVEPISMATEPAWPPDLGFRSIRYHWRSDAEVGRVAAADLKSGALDHIVARLFLPTPGWVAIADSGDLSLEIHSPLWRSESLRDLPRVTVGAPTSRRLVARARAGFFVTSQLSEGREYHGMQRRLVIGNGVELQEPLVAPQNDRPRLGMSVGSTAHWHGLDRFASWAELLPDYEFVIIAPDSLIPELRRELGAKPVSLLETASRSSYREALATLDAAVGGMAYDRRNLTEAAPLKVRDYVNAGIPTVLTYRDTNLHEVVDPALLRLPEWTETALLDKWLSKISGERLGETSRQAVSIDMIEKRRLDFLGLLPPAVDPVDSR